eukprot:CAMPEP_0115139202 /NCGR_PEP_ID=MMETSP0227-20121206/58139_1 /TAXON_ID=89957 /ORGANISM="Polarella glacialis, Strain CCMP 1383" /LENGTH=102 /DNA_ID=CAMNT_0002547003 /DNA_START=82 /DNA_END=390 /DNA_ORIENTATION=-
MSTIRPVAPAAAATATHSAPTASFCAFVRLFCQATKSSPWLSSAAPCSFSKASWPQAPAISRPISLLTRVVTPKAPTIRWKRSTLSWEGLEKPPGEELAPGL